MEMEYQDFATCVLLIPPTPIPFCQLSQLSREEEGGRSQVDESAQDLDGVQVSALFLEQAA